MGPDIVITGYWDGEPIWRRRTASEKLLFELHKMEQKHDGCEKCEGTGLVAVPNGEDDSDLEECLDCHKASCICDSERMNWEERLENLPF